MSSAHRVCFALGAAVVLAACATTSQPLAQRPSPPPAPKMVATEFQPRFEEDAAYIAKVEELARIRGIDLHWVHRPVKRTVDPPADGRQ